MDWAACAELLRLQQWQMSQRILATADALYQQVRLDPSPATASLDHRASRMVQIAIKLGRQAAGMDLKPAIPTGPPPLTPEEQADVDAFYPATPAPTTPPPPPAPTASANVTPPAAPAPAQPGAAGSTLNPQPASPSVPESKIENQNPKIPQPAPATPAPSTNPQPSTLNPQPSATTLPENRGAFGLVSQPVALVLQFYQKLARLELEVDSSVPKGALITVVSGPSVTRSEALLLLEKALRTQAGVLLTPLDPRRVRVTCNEPKPQNNRGP